MYIVIDGPDFSGKSTQVKLLKESLLKEVQSEDHLLVVREPGGTGNAEAIRNLLLDDSLKTPLAETELLLFVAARYELHQTVIKPFIEKMKEEKVEKWYIISDRSLISSWAYQCHTKKLEQYFDLLHDGESPVIKPDLAFVLIPTLEELQSRMAKSKSGLDRMERKGEEYLKTTLNRYSRAYKARFCTPQSGDINDLIYIDANQDSWRIGEIMRGRIHYHVYQKRIDRDFDGDQINPPAPIANHKLYYTPNT